MPIRTGNSNARCTATAAFTADLGDANAAHTPSPVWLNMKPPWVSIAERNTVVVRGECCPHGIGVGLPPTGRPLDIGKQKRHHPRRSSRGHGIASAHFICPSKPSDVAIAR